VSLPKVQTAALPKENTLNVNSSGFQMQQREIKQVKEPKEVEKKPVNF
jgi:hypothetical protein